MRHLLDNTVYLLRQELNSKLDAVGSTYEQQKAQLEADADWNRLSADQQASLKAQHSLSAPEHPQLGTAEALQDALDTCELEHWVSRTQALPSRFDAARPAAVQLLNPNVRSAERRVGTECVSTCRFRGETYH